MRTYTRLFVIIAISTTWLFAVRPANATEEYQWSLRYGIPFDPVHPDPSLKPVESNEIPEHKHISAVRITKGDGLDVVTFDYAQVVADNNGSRKWVDNNHADNLIYKYSESDRKAILSDDPSPNKRVIDDQGAGRGTHPIVLVRFEPEDRLESISVYSPTGRSFAISGLVLHIVSVKGGHRDIFVLGGKCDPNRDPQTKIGKAGEEIDQIKVWHGKALDAIGVHSRPIATE